MKTGSKLLSVLVLGAPGVAMAHGFETGGGLLSGLLHPLTGLDHLLALVGIALLGAQVAGKARWLVPLVFLATMVLGSMIAMQGQPFVFVEVAIALSLLLIGSLLVLRQRKAPLWCALLASVFALAHGIAHAVEMPVSASPAAFMSGFVLSGAMVQFLAVGLGMYAQRFPALASFPRLVGLLMAGLGLHLISG